MPVLSHGHPGEAQVSLSVFALGGAGRGTLERIFFSSSENSDKFTEVHILYNLLAPLPTSTTSIQNGHLWEPGERTKCCQKGR